MGRGAEIGVVPDKAAHKIRPRGPLPCFGGWETWYFARYDFGPKMMRGPFFQDGANDEESFARS